MEPPTRLSASFAVGRPARGWFLDSVEVDTSGLVRLIGWTEADFDPRPPPSVHLDGESIPFLQHFCFKRTDLTESKGAIASQAGLVLEFLVPESILRRPAILEIAICVAGVPNLLFQLNLAFVPPHYRSLLNIAEVAHREHIYGFGPPNTAVHPEVLELARNLEGPVLDFGCGRGVLVRELRRNGVEAHGLELDSPMIREAIAQEDADGITLYDGTLPSPYKDGQFRSVMCSEVLEHIVDYQAAIRDMARLATRTVVFTVPDASAIPRGFRHGVIPWHLLESTHVNFFTQQSLKAALEPYFSSIDFGRIGATRLNDSSFHVSLAAVCMK